MRDRNRSSAALDAIRQAGRPVTVREIRRAIDPNSDDDVKHYSTTMLRLHRGGKIRRVGTVTCPISGRSSIAYTMAS